MWLLLIFFVHIGIVLSLEFTSFKFFSNPASNSLYQDKYRQGYLIGSDSYYYLNQAASNNNLDAESNNLVINIYRIISNIVEEISNKEPKYFLYFLPLVIASLVSLCIFISMSQKGGLLLAASLTLILITSPSFFKNTQLGNIDHNGFYTLAFVLIISLSAFLNESSLKKNFLVFVCISLLLYGTSTFWGSWYLLLVPILFLILPTIISFNRKALIPSIGIITVVFTMIVGFFYSSGYVGIFFNKIFNLFGVVQTDQLSRLNFTQELEGISFTNILSLEPILLLLILCLIGVVFSKDKCIHLKVIPYLLINIFFLVATLIFIRLSIFFVISTVFLIHTIYVGFEKNIWTRKVFFIGCFTTIMINCLNTFNLHNQTERFDDVQYRQFNLVKRLTEIDSIILSWWDFGYYINNISQRYAYLDPGSKSTNDRLSLFSNIVYENNSSSIDQVRKQSCLDRRITIDKCTEENVPIYLLLTDKFDIFHPVMRQFSSKNIRNKLPTEVFSNLNSCQSVQKNILCGNHHFTFKNNQLEMVSSKKDIGTIVINSATGANRYEINNGNKVLILFQQPRGYKLVETNDVIESTLFFRGIFYQNLEGFTHQIVHQERINQGFSLIKLVGSNSSDE